jgi:integrase
VIKIPSVWTETRYNKNGKNYLIRWEMRFAGKRVRGAESCGPSKQFMLDRLKTIRENVYSGKPVKPVMESTPVSQWADECLKNSKNTKAESTYKRFDYPAVTHFATWFGDKPLGMVDAKILIAWRDALFAKGYNANTVRMRLRALSAAFGYAVTMGFLDRNPFEVGRKSHIYPKAVPAARYLTAQEVGKILKALPLNQAKAVYFILHTGLRHGELLGMEWKHLQGDSVEIPKTKTGNPRSVRIVQNVLNVIGKGSDGKIFEGVTTTWLGKSLRAACADLGLGAVRVHDLRHTWATNFMYRTGNVFELMYQGGWKSMASAAVYQHIRRQGQPMELPPFSHYFPTKAKDAAHD